MGDVVGVDVGMADLEAKGPSGVLQLRLVVHAQDYEEALRFYRDVLGMPEQEAYSGDGGAEVTILDAGRATLELSNTAQVELIDRVEVGRRVAPHLRVALEVTDGALATQAALAGRSPSAGGAHRDAVALPQLAPRGPGRGAAHAVRGARRLRAERGPDVGADA